MLRKLIAWFIMWGISWVIQSLGFAEQGKAFIVVSLVGYALLALLMGGIGFAGLKYGDYAEEKLAIFGFGAIGVIISLWPIVLMLGSCWLAIQFFPMVPFVVAYQLMSFGRCFVGDSSKKKG